MAQDNTGTAASIGLLLMRVTAGGLLLYGHGWPKLLHFAERASRFPDPLGIGSPRSLALAVFAEVLCAACVVLGFATRFASIPILILLGVAAFRVLGGAPWSDRELALVYAAPFLALVLTGGGRYSLDARFGPKVSFGGK
jgi:putative oxidoreductase